MKNWFMMPKKFFLTNKNHSLDKYVSALFKLGKKQEKKLAQTTNIQKNKKLE
jgi:hypothetical protein